MQKHIWLVNSLSGHYNSQFAQFLGKNIFGWRDRDAGQDNSPIAITVEFKPQK